MANLVRIYYDEFGTMLDIRFTMGMIRTAGLHNIDALFGTLGVHCTHTCPKTKAASTVGT